MLKCPVTRVLLVLALFTMPVGEAQAEDLTYCYKGDGAANAGNYDLAIDHYTRCLNEGELTLGTQVILFNNRGVAYEDKGDYDRAIADYDQAIRLEPDYASAFNNRGVAYRLKSDYDRAIRDYDQAIRLKPDYALAFNNRGYAYRQKGEYDHAIRDYDQAIRLKPDYVDAYNGKAWLLATARDAYIRNGAEAVRLAREAIRLDDNPYTRDTLAAAYAEAGRFNDAMAEQERAIEMLRRAGKDDEIAKDGYRTRLDHYRNRQPYRE